MEFPRKMFSKWSLTLRVGGKEGRPIIKITRASGSDYLVEGVGVGGENWKRPFVRGGLFKSVSSIVRCQILHWTD